MLEFAHQKGEKKLYHGYGVRLLQWPCLKVGCLSKVVPKVGRRLLGGLRSDEAQADKRVYARTNRAEA